MNALVLILAVVISFPFCAFRRKKYNITLPCMFLVYIAFSINGAIGASIGSYLASGYIAGKRLYGLILFDAILIIIMSKLLKIETGRLGDFVAIPLIVTCFSSKIDCLIKGCCYGITIGYSASNDYILFPSALLEMFIWLLLALFLLVLEKKSYVKDLLWPIAMIWFGILRFVVDFFRGSPSENKVYLFGMTGGCFWSLIVFVFGCIFLYFSIRYKIKRNPKIIELLKSIIGANYIIQQ
ncbi:MAG: prolipoprotein diacylglyceryl transferase [Ruminococcaceae bacterium]|nr:prolipoprotein diacylglyceryl transferase [Oscillospiraceae bacterium]